MANNQKNNTNNTNNTNINNEVLSPKTIKLQLQAACANMDASQTKEYIKKLDGYSIKQTGANKDKTHATIFYGDVRICNVENVQGITKEGTARGCVSVAKVNLEDAVLKVYENKYKKLYDDFTDDDRMTLLDLESKLFLAIKNIQDVFDKVNERAAAAAKEAAAAKRAAAAKEKAQKKVGEKIAAGSDTDKITAIAAALNVSYEVAATIYYKEKKQTA